MPTLSQKYLRIARTSNLYLSFFALGLCMAIPGPTLLDLQTAVGTDTSHIAFIYLARSSGYLLGSLFGGIMFDCINRKQPLLILCNLIMSITAIATPWSRDLVSLIIAMAGGGLAMGAIDTGGNVWCLNLWGKDSGPYFQALHFVFGLGAFLSPLIAEPFLSNRCAENIFKKLDNYSNASVELPNIFPTLHTSAENCTVQNLPLLNMSNWYDSIPSVTFAYAIIGGYAFFVTLLFIILFIAFPQEHALTEEVKHERSEGPGILFTIVVVFFATALLAIYAGIEIGYGQMIATFAVKGNLKLSKSMGSFMTSVFWGTFTLSRGISIFLASRLTSVSLVFGDLILMILGGVVLIAFGNSYVEFLWGGTAILGAGLASFYPSTITWIERYINVTNKVASLFVVAASLGEMVIPLTISQFVDTKPEALLYIVVASEGACCVLTLILWIITKRKGEKYDEDEDEDELPEEQTELHDMKT